MTEETSNEQVWMTLAGELKVIRFHHDPYNWELQEKCNEIVKVFIRNFGGEYLGEL